MTLKEKFKNIDIRLAENNFTYLVDLEAVKCEKIADEFAIGFAEWFADNTLRVDLDGYKTFGDTDETKPHTIKQLLEIYKKEKDL